MRYQIVVGNVGTTLETDNRLEALEEYWDCIEMTERPGRAEGESVTVFRNGEIFREHAGKHNAEE